MTLQNTRNKVKIQGELSEEFRVEQGLKQGDALSTVLFNLTLEKLIRAITITNRGTLRSFLQQGTQWTGTIYNQRLQYLAYADDVAILGRAAQDIKKAFIELSDASMPAGLHVNDDKTKYMVMTRDARMLEDLDINGRVFGDTTTFKYLGALITCDNETTEEIKERICAGNRCYFSTLHLLKSRVLSRRCKKIIYRTIIRPVVTYGCETWVMTRRSEELLNRWERKILRKVYGPVRDQGEWRIRTNNEIYALYQEATIVAEIKKARIRWLGHVERMPDNRAARAALYKVPQGRRRVGRPRMRWLDDVEADLVTLGVNDWRRRAHDRADWRDVAEQAKALHGL